MSNRRWSKIKRIAPVPSFKERAKAGREKTIDELWNSYGFVKTVVRAGVGIASRSLLWELTAQCEENNDEQQTPSE